MLRRATAYLSYRKYRARLAWAVWRGWLDTVPVGYFDGTSPPPLSLSQVDELLEVLRLYGEDIGPMAEFESLPTLREMRIELAARGERA